jgi:hypothetical protein
MVHGEERHVFTLSQSQEGSSPEWAARQIEWALRLFLGQKPDLSLPLPLFRSAQFDQRQRHLCRRIDHLDRRISPKRKGGPQEIVPPGDLSQCSPQHFEVQLPAQPQGERDVIDRAIRYQPIEEPQSLLRERERRPIPDRTPGNGFWFLKARSPFPCCLEQQSPLNRRQFFQPFSLID